MTYRVLMISRHLQVAGASHHMLHLTRGLVRLGHTVHILAGRGELADSFTAEGATVHTSPVLEQGYSGVLKEARQIRYLVQAHHLDLVHSHALSSTLATGVSTFRQNPKVPLVATVHSLQSSGLYFRQTAGLFLRAFPQHTIYVSEFVRSQVGTAMLGPLHFSIIPNGVDLAALQGAEGLRQEYRQNLEFGKEVVVGTVGRLSPEKGHRCLLDAWRALVKQRPQCRLLVIGDGPERLFLERYVAEQDLAASVRILGRRNDVPALLQALDIFVLPSLRESHPLALLEAMAVGLPVVATRVGGVPEIIEDGKHGVLVRANDPQELEYAMRTMIDDPQRAAKLGSNGNLLALKAFSVETMVNRVARVYSQVLEDFGKAQIR